MHKVIDLVSELLIDASTVRDPYVRLLTAAVGQRLAPGSPWVAVNERVAVLYCLPFDDSPVPLGCRARWSCKGVRHSGVGATIGQL